MKTYWFKNRVFYSVYSILLLVVLAVGSASALQTKNLPQTLTVTKNSQIAYYIYHRYPHHYRHGYHYYAPHCQKRCLVNRHGVIVRCIQRCY